MATIELVSLAQMLAYLRLTTADDKRDALLGDLLLEATDLLQRECGRPDVPFQAAQTARTETRPGINSQNLWLDYPIDSITSIAIGVDWTKPMETLDPANRAQVYWEPGTRKLVRVDGGMWSNQAGAILSWARGATLVPDNFSPGPCFVQVKYAAQEDQPPIAQLAVKRVVAACFTGMGNEGLSSERRGERSWTIADYVEADPIWRRVADPAAPGNLCRLVAA